MFTGCNVFENQQLKMPAGPLIDSFGTLTGALLGAFMGNKFPERLRTMLPLTFGIVSMAMGVVMIAKVNMLPPVILAMLIVVQ